MANDPYQSGMMPDNSRQGLYNLRMMSSANRMETPFERGGRSMYAHQGVSGNPMLASMAGMSNEPDYSSFTFDPRAHAQATDMLSQYGLAPLETSQVKNNVLLPNSGFFGAHPRLSAALESGMFGAVAAHGGATAGDSIQGALEGVIGGQRIRQGMYRQQFARPFEAAGMMEGMQDMQQRRELQAADIEHLRAVNEHLKNGDDEKAQALMETNRHSEAMEAIGAQNAANKNSQIEAQAPRNLGGGLYGYYSPGGTGPNQKGEWSIQENPEAKLGRANSRAANQGPWYTYNDPKTGKPVWGRASVGAQVPEGSNAANSSPAMGKETISQKSRREYISKTRKPSELLKMGYQGDILDGKAQEKFLGDFYDQNIGPNIPSAPQGIKTYNPQTGKLE